MTAATLPQSIRDDRFMRMAEVAKLLSVSERSVYYMIQRRRFPPGVGIGDRTVVWSSRAVQEWMQHKINNAARGNP